MSFKSFDQLSITVWLSSVMKLLSSLVFALSAFCIIAEKARFDNYQVYSVAVETKEQLIVLKEIEDTSDSVSS